MLGRLCLLLTLSISLQACSGRVRFTPGEIPPPTPPTAAESADGHKTAMFFGQYFRQTPNKDLEKAVARVGTRLIKACDATKDAWTIYVFNAPQVSNAAVTKGKYIFVWDGLFNDVKNDHELAAVLAHEIGHFLAQHQLKDGIESATETFAKGTGGIAEGMRRGPNTAAGAVVGLTSALVSFTTKKVFIQPEKHRKELEADMIGMFLMAHAGYDPSKAVDLWTRMSANETDGGILSSHPTGEERLEQLRELLPSATVLYKASPLALLK